MTDKDRVRKITELCNNDGHTECALEFCECSCHYSLETKAMNHTGDKLRWAFTQIAYELWRSRPGTDDRHVPLNVVVNAVKKYSSFSDDNARIVAQHAVEWISELLQHEDWSLFRTNGLIPPTITFVDMLESSASTRV